MKIAIISSSVRTGRASHRVALFLQQYISQNTTASVEILDLLEYKFPIFEERLKFQTNPLPTAVEFAERIKAADGIIVVCPEYNGGVPASLKNVVDLLYAEWVKKPIAISTVSSGSFAGSQVLQPLQFSLWKIGAITVPSVFPVPSVEKTFDEAGVPSDKEATEKRAKTFVGELLWYIEASQKMKS